MKTAKTLGGLRCYERVSSSCSSIDCVKQISVLACGKWNFIIKSFAALHHWDI
jgi:hypothetical protein